MTEVPVTNDKLQPTTEAPERTLDARTRGLLAIAGLVIMALAGTLLLYREALGLPFFFDDMIHLRWLDWHSLSQVWTTAEGLGYYRPLTMSVWKVGYLLLGYNDPAGLHLFNLLLHALNTILAGAIAWRTLRGPGRYAFGLATAALFMAFPFSFQAVPSTSSLSKPLIATLTLASALLYWQARRRDSWWLLALSLLAGFLAPFAYETGVMVPLAIVAVEALGILRKEFERISWLPVLHMVLIWAVALPIIVLMEPETGASLRLPELGNLWQNAVYFGQGLAFPVAPLGTPLVQVLGVDEYLVVGLINLAALVGLWAFYRWNKQDLVFWYALSWFAVGVFPLWLMLDFAYVITSPRLIYLGAVGSAMLWAGIPVLLWLRRPTRWWTRVLAVGAMVGMLVLGVAYVREKMVLAKAVAEPIWQAVEAAADVSAEASDEDGESASLLYLNVPAWVAPKTPVYRIGSEGLTFIPQYVRVQDSVYVNSGIEPEIRAHMYDPVKKEWDGYIGYAGEGLDQNGVIEEIRHVDGVYLMSYTPDGLRFVEAGGMEGAREGLVAQFGEEFELVANEADLRGSELTMTLWWHAPRKPEGNLTVFMHVYDESGQLVAQADGLPIAGLFPAWAWDHDTWVRDVRIVDLPADLAGGEYSVAVGWYNADSGERLPAVDQEGNRAVQDAMRIYEFSLPSEREQ